MGSRMARAQKNGEHVEYVLVEALGPDERDRIVQLPGNRGFLRGTWPRGNDIAVCTTAGIADYPRGTEVMVWGP